MSYDLNVLVLQQEKPYNFTTKSSIVVKDESQEILRYHGIWTYMTQSKGVWYCLGKEDDEIFSALSIVNADFDSQGKNTLLPYWVASNEDIISNLVPMTVSTKYKIDFVKIIKQMIEQSPIKTILLLARMQGGDDEIVCGVLSFKNFLDFLDEGKILFNVCYIIRS